MSRREVTDCDRCKAKEIQAGTLHIAVGYDSCPAGGRGEDREERIDLCGKCLVALVNWLKRELKLDYEQGKKIVAWVNDYKGSK